MVDDEATRDALYAQLDELHDKICSTGATTFAGAAVQLRLTLDVDEGGSCLSDLEMRALELVVKLLERVA
jgi:hypothetical protein